MNNIQPKISVLNNDQILNVHAESLKVLSRTGIRVDSPHAQKIFAQSNGCTLEGDIVRILPEMVESSIKSAPSSIEIYTRDGEHAFTLSDHQMNGTIYGIGVTNSWYQNPADDSVASFTREHIQLATSLGNTLKQFDIISTPGVIQKDTSGFGEIVASLEMMANTSKPLSLLISDPSQYQHTLDMVDHLSESLAEKPFILPYFNPITPLVFNEDTTDKMFTTIQRGLPFIFSSYGMSGATSPISAGGSLVLLNAELLAGLVLSQLIKSGTPVVLGSLPSVFEMQTMISTYTTQTMLVNLACAEMMHHYGIPHAGTSGSGTGWGPDLPASGTLWMNHLTSSIGKVGLAPFVGGNFDSQAFSPTTVVYANEIIRQVRQFAAGFSLDEFSAIQEELETVGPGGSFVLSDSTLDRYMEIHQQHSKIWPRFPLEQWQSEGSPTATHLLRQYTGDILENPKIPEDHNSILGRGEEFINSLKDAS